MSVRQMKEAIVGSNQSHCIREPPSSASLGAHSEPMSEHTIIGGVAVVVNAFDVAGLSR